MLMESDTSSEEGLVFEYDIHLRCLHLNFEK